MSIRILSIILLFSVIGCEQYTEVKSTPYFKLDSLLTAQVDQLSQRNVTLKKKAMVNGEVEEETLEADSSLWAEELAIFRELDLNKPGTLNAYEVSKSNSRIVYNLKPEEKQSGVISMEIELEGGVPAKLEAEFVEDNNLYTSNRKYLLTFSNQAALKSYKITGRQKVAFGDWVDYEVEGEIVK